MINVIEKQNRKKKYVKMRYNSINIIKFKKKRKKKKKERKNNDLCRKFSA